MAEVLGVIGATSSAIGFVDLATRALSKIASGQFDSRSAFDELDRTRDDLRSLLQVLHRNSSTRPHHEQKIFRELDQDVLGELDRVVRRVDELLTESKLERHKRLSAAALTR